MGNGRKAHVFVVDRFSFPVHSHRLFCGVKDPRREGGFSGRWGLYSCLKCTRVGDLVFFYQRRIDEPSEERGFRGVYEIASDPFFDDSDVQWSSFKVLGKCPHCGTTYPEKSDEGNARCVSCGCTLPYGEHIAPNRILIKPVHYFEKSVDDNTAYVDQTDPGTLWTMLFRKVYGPGRERSVTPILPEEARKLIRLLKRVNKGLESRFEPDPYNPANRTPIRISLGYGPKVEYEHTLQAWLMENIDKDIPVLKEVVGPREELEWFGNEVMYGIGGDKVDVLCLHSRDGIRFKATVFELKDDEVQEIDVKQIERYSYWISQLATANAEPRVKSLSLQPVLVGHHFPKDALSLMNAMKPREIRIPYQWGECVVNIQPPIGLAYTVQSGNIVFKFAKAH
ncbi:MAG: hypothetical protein ACP5KV_05115 [Candidatus Methanomethylicaceae archaeon]